MAGDDRRYEIRQAAGVQDVVIFPRAPIVAVEAHHARTSSKQAGEVDGVIGGDGIVGATDGAAGQRGVGNGQGQPVARRQVGRAEVVGRIGAVANAAQTRGLVGAGKGRGQVDIGKLRLAAAARTVGHLQS